MAVTFLTDKDPVLRYDEQALTGEQQMQVRKNVHSASSEDLERVSKPLKIISCPNLSEQSSASTTATGYLNTSSGWFGEVKAGETYTFSADFHKPADSDTKNIGVRVYSAKSGGAVLQEKVMPYSSVPVGGTARLSGTFTAKSDGFVSLNGAFTNLGEAFLNYEIATNIQLELGNKATEYCPYGEKALIPDDYLLKLEEQVEDTSTEVSKLRSAVRSYVPSIAHQGGRGYGYPQNTVENAIAAAKHGWKFNEFDIRWTADGVPVVSHDDDRSIYGSSETIKVTESTYDQLAAVQLFEDASIKIPTFYEMIDVCKLYGMFAVIEFKNWPDDTQVMNLLEYLRYRGMLRRCMWLSFNFDPLVRVATHDEQAIVTLLKNTAENGAAWVEQYATQISKIVRSPGTAIISWNYSILPSVDTLDTYFKPFRDVGFDIGIFTVDSVSLIQKYAVHADYITSNLYRVEDALI